MFPTSEVDGLNVLDEKLEAAIQSGDEEAFKAALAELLSKVREAGKEVAVDELVSVRPAAAVLRRHPARGSRPAQRRRPDPWPQRRRGARGRLKSRPSAWRVRHTGGTSTTRRASYLSVTPPEVSRTEGEALSRNGQIPIPQ